MEIKKELDSIFDDPLMNISHEETKLFDVPADMKKTMQRKKKPDYVAQRTLCENFELYRPLFTQVHQEMKAGKRNLIRITKTTNLQEGYFYISGGQMLYLEKIIEKKRIKNGMIDGRTRCIYENGTESDILLQTLRKSVVGDGYAITETEQEKNDTFFSNKDIENKDKVTGYIYVVKSLSDNPEIANVENLYKIGFTTASIEERTKNAEHEPTYLMAPVKLMSSYKVVNMNSHQFEEILHRVLAEVNFSVQVTDDKGQMHKATEWYVAPIAIIDKIIEKIMSGDIVHYLYNKEAQCLERHLIKKQSQLDLKRLKVLTLNIKKTYFDLIISGEKKEEYRAIKQTMLNRYTYVDEADGKRYLRRYDVLHLFVGYHKDRESAVVEIVNTTYAEGIVVYRLGRVLEVVSK